MCILNVLSEYLNGIVLMFMSVCVFIIIGNCNCRLAYEQNVSKNLKLLSNHKNV